MSLKLATLIAHDGKTVAKVDPGRVNYLISPDKEFTKIHFGLDQTVDVSGGLDAAGQLPGGN